MDFLKSFDWRGLKKYLSPKATEDLNAFLENLPQKAGQTALIAASIAWMAAGAVGLYTFIQVQALTELREKLKDTTALKPLVPTIREVPIRAQEIASFTEALSKAYPQLNIRASGSNIQISAISTAQFGAFREAIGHVQNGGTGWRLKVENFCAGRECPQFPLGVLIKVNKVSVDKPAA